MKKIIISLLFILSMAIVVFGQNNPQITQTKPIHVDNTYVNRVSDEDRQYLTTVKLIVNDEVFQLTVVGDTSARNKALADASSVIDERVTQLTTGAPGTSVDFNSKPIDKDFNKHLFPSEDLFVRQFARAILKVQGRNTAEEVQAVPSLEEAMVIMFGSKTFNAKGINSEAVGHSVKKITYAGMITDFVNGQFVNTAVFICLVPKQDQEENHYNDDARHMPSVNSIITPRVSDILTFDGKNATYNVLVNCRFRHGRADEIKRRLKPIKDDENPRGSDKFCDYVIEGGPGFRADGTHGSSPEFAIIFQLEE